jgi:hypothetical protein
MEAECSETSEFCWTVMVDDGNIGIFQNVLIMLHDYG